MKPTVNSATRKLGRRIFGISPSFIASLSRQLALATLAAVGLGEAQAANKFWDPNNDGVTIGGLGNWDITSTFWDPAAADALTANNVAWVNANNDTAVFGGIGGTVTISGGTGVTAGGLTFSTLGYTIGGATASDVLTLGGATPTISVTNSTDFATITATVAGTTGLIKDGAGTLNLAGANTFTGNVNVNAGTLVAFADNSLGAAANPINLNGGILSAAGTFSSTRLVTLGATGGTLDVSPGFTLTLTTALAANANALVKTGSGTLLLNPTAASARTGPTAVSNGILNLGNVGAAGTGDITVTNNATLLDTHNVTNQNFPANVFLNGGTFSLNPTGNIQLNFTGGKFFDIGTNGGTVNVSPGTGATSKILLTAGQLQGAGLLTKTGPGVMQLSGANPLFTGTVTINQGTLEFQNVDALGSLATTVIVNNGGDFVTSAGVNNRNNVTLNTGGTISANIANGTFSGNITAAGNATIALRQFQTTTTAISFNVSGPISGSGNLTVTAPAAATLTLSSDRTAHTGQIIPGTNATVAYTNPLAYHTPVNLAGGVSKTVFVNSAVATNGVQGLNATYYNTGFNPNVSTTVPVQFATDNIYVTPRAFSRIDANVNIPVVTTGTGEFPIIPVPGFAYGTTVGGQNDAIMWKGLLNITNAGFYQFLSATDDQDILYIDGVPIGTHAGNTGGNITNLGTPVNLTSGKHSIVYKMTNGATGGYAVLQYFGGFGTDAETQVTIPSSVLSTGSLAALDLGPITTTAAGGGIDFASPATSSSITLGGGTFTLTSPTIDNFTAPGMLLTGNVTLAPTSAGLIVTAPITEDTTARALTFAGPYFGEFQAVNTYTGGTTVTGGQLRLNVSGGNAFKGNLTLNAPNANGPVVNVSLSRPNQIEDTATLTMTSGILDLGPNSELISALIMNGGTILGTAGVLTVTNAPTLAGGVIAAQLAGNWNLVKSGTGTATLTGNNTYTGVTNVDAGVLNAFSTNALGAGGAGNGTVVASGASLRLGGANVASENVTISGTGLAADSSEGAIRNLGGVSQIHDLKTGAAATVRVDSGEVIVTGALDVSGGALTKTGNGVLTFATPQSVIPTVTHVGGAIGFSGTQNFGAVPVPAGLAYQFDTNPLTGGGNVSLTVPATSTVIANFPVDQSFLGIIAAGSTGTLALTGTNPNNLDFSTVPNVTIGTKSGATITGTLTPNAAGYQLGGGGGKLTVQSVLAGNVPLNITGEVQLNGQNTFTGTATIKAGGKLVYVNDQALGTPTNSLVLDGGTLQMINTSAITGGTGTWATLGYPANGGGRILTVGANGGTIDIPSGVAQGNFGAIVGTNTLIGSGALAKTGLGFLEVLTSNSYSGVLTLAANGNRVDLRANGALPNITGLVIESRAEFDVDNNSTLGSTRLNASVDNRNRFNDAAPITLNGGILRFVGRNVAFAAGTPATSQENFGTVTAGFGQSLINSTRTGGGGSDMVIGNLIRTYGNGTINFTTDGNTLGITGDNPRIFLNQVNGAAPAFNSFIGGWATINQSDFAAYGNNATIGGAANTVSGIVNYGTVSGTGAAPTYTALTAAATPGTGGFSSGIVGNAAASLALGNAGAGQNFVVGALRFGSGATAEVISFTDTSGTPDTLFVESGGIITDNGAGAKSIGVTTNAFTRGQLTAGTIGASTPQELFFHNNTAATLTIASTVIDNPSSASATVRVVKAQDGTVVLDSGADSYSGGTLVLRGTLTANNTGSLGKGAVVVKNALINVANTNATSGTVGIASTDPVYTTFDQATIVLTGSGTTVSYTGSADRFSIASGSSIYANSGSANFGFNSLTRIAAPNAFTGGGQIYLAPGAIVKHNVTNAANQGTGILTIKNLGTAADLFFAPVTAANTAAFNQTVTVGTGTPWAGLSSDRSNLTWNGGTIFANSDFIIQGLVRDGGNGTFTLGENNTSGSTATKSGGITFVNNTNGPINARLIGTVIIAEDEPITMPANFTYVVTAGALFQPNTSGALGYGTNKASVVVQAGGNLDPGNYTPIGTGGNQQFNPDGSLNGFQNLPYPLVSPLNGSVTVEAGGKLLINDPSGIGSAPAGSYTIKNNGILDLGTANAFFGRGTYSLNPVGTPDTTGLAVPGQFVYEPGAVVRLNADNIYKVSQFTSPDSTFIVFGANRTYTNNNNPFIIPVAGTPTIAPEDLHLASGGMLTDDSNDRQLNEGRGRLVLDSGAILSSTTGTYFSIQEGWAAPAGANITIGAAKYVDGMSKLGAVQLNGPNSNVAGAGVTFTVTDGAQLSLAGANVFPDNAAIVLTAPVTGGFPGTGGLTTHPSTGSTLLINTASFLEVIGNLTGNGAVIPNQTAAAIAVNPTSDITSNVSFKLLNTFSTTLVKTGPNTLTLTGNSDSQGSLSSYQGTIVVSNGTSDWGDVRPFRGGTIVVDNTVNATNNRLGLPSFLVGAGGTFELKGNATTAVTEQFNALASGTGNLFNQAQNPMISTVKVTAGNANTTLQFLSIENYVATGQRLDSYIINTPTVGNLPMKYSTASAIIPTAGNISNGLVEVVVPNFGGGVGNTGLVSGAIFGSSGTPLMAIRNDLLGDANGDGIPEGLATQDGVNYVSTNTSGTNVITGLPTLTGLSAGMLVNGTGIPAGTRIQTVDTVNNQIILTNNTTAAATNLNVIVGGLRNLAASEYATFFRDNQTVGTNVKLSGTANISGDTRVQTLTITPGSTLNITGTLPLNATASRLLLNSSAIFVQPGGTSSINAGPASGNTENYLQFIGGSGFFFHTWGDLNLNAKVFTDIGVVKTGPGTLNFGPGAFQGFRGSFQIDGGTVNLAAGNSVENVRSQNGSTGTNFYINSGTLNLAGNSQMINLLNSASELPGQGGTVTSSTAATITNVGGGRFAGNLDGAISLDKTGNNTLLLTNPQTYTGTTTIRAGTLVLRDSATLSATSGQLTIRNATVQLDNGYLSNVPNRIAPAIPVVMNSGTLNLTGAAGQVASQTINNLTLASGFNNFTSNAGGSGANELNIGNLIRANGSGATVNIQQNYGFVGTAGNNTTAIRDFITNVNGAPLALNNGLIGAWAVVNGDAFATYRPATGVGAYGNTADGYPAYESTNATTALATQNVNDGTARTIGVNSTINSWRIAPNAAVTMTIGTAATLTIGSGGLLTNNNNTVTFASGGAGAAITSGTGELDVFVNQNTTIFQVPITGSIDLVKTGGGAITLSAVNTYTGTTYISGGTANLSLAGADGAANVVTTGRLVLDATTVTETVANQLSATVGDITLVGGARYNLVNTAGVTETIRSLTFLDGSSGTGTTNGLDRTALQLGSTINLSGANAITSTNTNPVAGVPFIGGFAGNIAFTNPAGATLNINSPTSVNGVLAVGLRIGARIGNVPNVAGGGLIKTGNGLLTIDPDQTPTFATTGSTVVGSPVITGITNTAGMVPGMQIAGTNIPAGSYIISVDSATQVTINTLPTVAGAIGTITAQPVNFTGVGTTLTDVLNVQSGTVRADRHGSLGTSFANTTVQNGAILLGANSGGQVITGSVTLKDGSTLGATINAFTLGAATDIAANQAILNIPSGNVNIATYDYYVPNSNSGNITINSKLTGSGNLNLYGQQITQGNGGGGFIQLSNPFGSGAGAGQTDYSGTITVGTNAILINQIALIPKNVATIPRATGSALGNATINLNGGRLRVRDDATSGTTAVSNGAVTYGNPVTLSANSFLDVGRVNTADTNSNNIIDFGALTVTAGTKVLNVDSNTGTGAAAGAGNYITRFSSLTGSGNFVKAGLGRLQFNDIPASFTGSITIAGPQSLVVAATFNTTTQANLILPTTTTVPAFNLGGFYITEAGKTLNVAGAFTVNSNVGDIATNKSNVPGALAVTNTTTLNVGSFVNNGVVGAAGGTATITSTSGFSGTGHYIGFNNQLTLNGPIGAIKVAGANNTSVTTTANSYDLTGVRIESGVLKLTPGSGAGTSTGNALVLGSPASTASATTAAIAAVSGALAFDGGPAGTFVHNGSITSSGTVRASGGTVTINGSINGTDLGYTPGLLEGYTTVPGGALDVSLTRAPNPGNFGIRMEPRMLQTNAVTQNALTGHTDNDTWVYTGYVKDDDGVFSFAENIDDRAAVWIDGALVLNAANGGTSRVVSTAYKDGQAGTGALTAGSNLGTPSQNFGPGISLPGFGDGWHLIEIRMNNGGGGSGPINGNGFAVNYGFGYKNGIAALDGGDMIKPIDNGTGNLFVTPVGGTTNIQVDAGATMNVPAFTKTGSVTLAGGTSSTPSFFNLTGSNSTAANLEVTGTAVPQGNVDVANNLTFTTGTLNVVAGGTLNINPTHSGTVVVTGNNVINGGGVVDVLNGTLNITSNSTGSGGGGVRVETGAKLIVDGSLLGSVDVSLAATLKGAGTFNGPTTLGFTATLDPDRTATAMMTYNNTSLLLGSDVVYDFALRNGGLSDTVAFTGLFSSLTITDTWTLKLTNGGLANPTGQTFILFDGDPLGAPLNAGLIGTPTIDHGSGVYAFGTISFDAANNDIILTGLVPEPGTAALLLGGMACLAGFRRRRQS